MTTSDLRRQIEAEFPEWLERRKDDIPRARHKIQECFDGTRTGNSIPDYFSYIAFYLMNQFVLEALRGHRDDRALAIATQCQVREIYCEAGRRRAEPDRRSTIVLPRTFCFTVSQAAVAGWREETELLARVGLAEVNRLLADGIERSHLAWFMLELMKDWLGAEADLKTPFRQAEVDGLGPWEKLLAGWRTHDQSAFAALMHDMAEHHVGQSHYMIEKGHKRDPNFSEQRFEVESSEYWLFPVELLAVLRLREWEGLANPPMTHPLFSTSMLGTLCPPLERVADSQLDTAFDFYRAKYPLTPTVEELPRLRREQGGEMVH